MNTDFLFEVKFFINLVLNEEKSCTSITTMKLYVQIIE